MQSGTSGFVSHSAPPRCVTLDSILFFSIFFFFHFGWLPVEKGESLESLLA